MIYDDCNELWPFDLLTASAVGDDEAVGQLLSDPDLKTLKNSKGWTPIMFAAYFGHSSLVSSLISSCWFDVRDRNDKGGQTFGILETVDYHSARLLDICAIWLLLMSLANLPYVKLTVEDLGKADTVT